MGSPMSECCSDLARHVVDQGQVLRLKELSWVLDDKKENVSDVILCCHDFYVLTLPLHCIGHFPIAMLTAWGHQLHYHLEIKEWTLSQSRKFAWQQ
ncbi:10990_t:CDS:2 [Ambispora gerdemannii]|uniref:10990_t:CDS:1 n=1 Tax=Ambispora gerdemannii TaxID=144530 RepID=A0A9N9CUD9_9GLOM|nr:10990_t:CDS:2 [Ambispora gerdemannii]